MADSNKSDKLDKKEIKSFLKSINYYSDNMNIESMIKVKLKNFLFKWINNLKIS